MATLFSSKTQRVFCCFRVARTFLWNQPRTNPFSTSTSKANRAKYNSMFISVIDSTIPNRASSSVLQRVIRNPSFVLPFRHYISLTRSNKLRQIPLRVSNDTPILCHAIFHTSPSRHVSPILWMIVKPVAKLVALFGGRRFRFWYHALPFEQKKLFVNWQNMLALMFVLIGLGATYYVSHLQEAPITKRIRFIAFTDDQFQKIATFEAKLQEKLKANLFLPATHPSYYRVMCVMEKLVHSNWALSNMKTHKWKVAIVDSSDINAYVLASGHVYVHIGLLNFVQNDNQLAIVLAHEMAHALLGHAAEKVSYAQIIDYFVIILMAAIWAFMPFDGIALITQAFYEKVVQILLDYPYSRKLEKEADIIGLQLAAKACYDVREGYNFWKLMRFSEQLQGSEIPEWLSTHPSNVNRQELIDHLLPKAISVREKSHCPPLSKEDPRNCLKRMEKMVQNVLTARMTGQNLSKLPKHVSS